VRTVVGGERRSFEIDRAMRRMLWDQRADMLMIKRARLEETRVKEDDNGQGQPAVVRGKGRKTTKSLFGAQNNHAIVHVSAEFQTDSASFSTDFSMRSTNYFKSTSKTLSSSEWTSRSSVLWRPLDCSSRNFGSY
jgi:hypothetical protein